MRTPMTKHTSNFSGRLLLFLDGVLPCFSLLPEPSPLGLAVFPEVFQELGTPIHLRPIVERAIQSNPPNFDRSIFGVVETALGDRPVDELDEFQLLLHREVPRQLIAA